MEPDPVEAGLQDQIDTINGHLTALLRVSGNYSLNRHLRVAAHDRHDELKAIKDGLMTDLVNARRDTDARRRTRGPEAPAILELIQ